ncbi:MAG: DNA cytosine methyltransferase [Gemmataceae bacterium]|nr:DNA cytosine methyltransferase [Gemmataceae bacterium]
MTRTLTVLALALLAVPAQAGFLGGKPSLPTPPKIDIPIKPPPIKIPTKPEDLDPTKKIKQELEKARAEALKTLNRFSPENVLDNVRKSIGQRLSKAEAQSGAKLDRATGEIDLRGTKIGRTLHSWLDKFAQGKESKGEVEELSYNVKTQVFKARLYARHQQRQNWGVLGKVDLYSVTQRAMFTFDFKKKSADFDLDLGKLAPKINKRTMEALAKGDLATVAEAMAPDLSAIGKYERKNDYDEILAKYQKRHGAANVYMSSRGFVSWAGSRTIGKYVADGVISGGTAVWPKIMAEAREMGQKELPGIASWLEGRGQKGAREMAQALLTGQKPRWPFIKFELVVVPHYAREVNPQTGVKTPWRKFPNLGFVIVFEPRLASK